MLVHHAMSNPLSLSQSIEALLLYQGGSLKIAELSRILEQPKEVVAEALTSLETDLADRGVSLVRDGETVALTTASGAKELIEKLRRDELEGAVGRAGLETLAIIMYRGPVSRADIEYIRGVTVSTMLRTLLIRGLIERVDNPNDKRSFLYKATSELPAYLGVTRLSDLPGYQEIQTEINAVLEGALQPEEL